MKPVRLNLTPDREALVVQWMGCARRFARRMEGSRIDFDEAFSEMSVTLVRAARKFDPEYGTNFSTYLWSCMRNAQRRLIERIKCHQRAFEDSGMSLCEARTSYRQSFDEPAADLSLRWSSILTDREWAVVRMRADGKTLRQISTSIGRTRERVRQILLEAGEKLTGQTARAA